MILNNNYKILFLLVIFLPIFDVIATENYHIEISKTEQRLSVFDGTHEIKRYHMAYGKGGNKNKQSLGDNRTPNGLYRINNFKNDSKFTLFMQLDYPNQADAWHAYREKRITAETYKRIVDAFRSNEIPPQDTKLGGYIGIHGIGQQEQESLDVHNISNWTQGCVAITDQEILELRQYVSLGTQVHIRP